jgi:hypothetical protein
MSEGPYRPDPQASEADAELARLAEQGQRRILEAGAAGRTQANAAALAEEKKRDWHTRLALGAYYGIPLRKACFALMGMGVMTFVTGGYLGVEGVAGVVGLVLSMLALVGGLVAALLIDPTATRARVAAERAWAASLPFAVDGYFDLLAQDPVIACRLLVELTWGPGRKPAPEIVRGAFGLWDAGVGVEPGKAATMNARGSPFMCGRYTRGYAGLSPAVPNRHLVGRVHRLVEKVLLPLHRSCALERVSLRREVVPRQPWEPFPNARDLR